MSEGISIYCDESSHLENDKSKIMGLGALSCPTDKREVVFRRIRELKVKHGMTKSFEIKWTKVSNTKLDFYMDLVNYFFDVDYLGFRAVIIDKSKIDHDSIGSNHDEFYYKMNFLLLKQLLQPTKHYSIYLDKKDTNGKRKIEKLHNYLCSNQFDYKKEVVTKVQEVVSDQVELVQLCDFILGAICYINRGLKSSNAKLQIIERIKLRSQYSLTKNTFPSEHKMNILIWVSGIKNGNDETTTD